MFTLGSKLLEFRSVIPSYLLFSFLNFINGTLGITTGFTTTGIVYLGLILMLDGPWAWSLQVS